MEVDMKKNLLVALLAILLVPLSLVNASIIGHSCADDGDGAIVMTGQMLGYDPLSNTYNLQMGCKQYGDPGHIEGSFTTDTPLDPKVLITEILDNDTTFAWTDYHIKIGMSKSFTIPTMYGIIAMAPDGWTSAVTQPVAGLIPNGGDTGWVGTIDYYVGTGSPIAVGSDGLFGFWISFAGSVSFCTEQHPTPEPATLALLCIGALALRRRK